LRFFNQTLLRRLCSVSLFALAGCGPLDTDAEVSVTPQALFKLKRVVRQ
jgi:hypothetical protein